MLKFGACIAAVCGGAAVAQTLPTPSPTGYPAGTPIEYRLWEAEQVASTYRSMSRMIMASDGPADGLAALLARRGIEVSPSRLVHCEVVGPNDGVASEEEVAGAAAELLAVRTAILDVGGSVPLTWMKRFDAWVPVARLTELAEMLPEGYFLSRSTPPSVDGNVEGEGPARTNSALYRQCGADGTGITIGLIDTQYDGFTAAQNNGDAPSGDWLTITNYPATAFETVGGNATHGTGCVENLYDHAPGATYRVYRIGNATHLGNAVTNMIAQGGPKIISHSLSWYNTGWADGTGAPCAAALNAAQNGILFFTSAGNRAQSHYQATFVAAGGNPIPGWHRWAGGDETNNITIPNNQTVSFHLQWNNADGVTDYDLYLYDNAIAVELARSINVGSATFESCQWTNTTGAAVTAHLGVRRMAGNAVEFEIFESTSASAWEYLTADNSTTSPSNTNHLNVLCIGAVDQSQWASPNGTAGIIEPYSSRGPTNGNLAAPDICGPTNTIGFTYPGGFGGTSSATPNCAGATAVLWSADTAVTPAVIRNAVYEWAGLYRDWGDAGRDRLYGRGGLILPEVRIDILPGRNPNPVYLSRNYTIYVGVLASSTFPVATLADASMRFGRAFDNTPAAITNASVQRHINGDGLMDSLVGFRTFDCAFQPASTRGYLKGRFTNGAPYVACDSVQVNP